MSTPEGMTRHTTPDLLVEGDTILADNGREYVVDKLCELDGAPAIILLRDDKTVAVPRSKLPAQVVLLESAAERHERAVALAQVRLGGEVVMERHGGPFRVPARFPDLASFLAHLYLAHQQSAISDGRPRDAKVPASFPTGNMRDAHTWHDDQHTRVLVVPHVHDDAFYRRTPTADV